MRAWNWNFRKSCLILCTQPLLSIQFANFISALSCWCSYSIANNLNFQRIIKYFCLSIFNEIRGIAYISCLAKLFSASVQRAVWRFFARSQCAADLNNCFLRGWLHGAQCSLHLHISLVLAAVRCLLLEFFSLVVFSTCDIPHTHCTSRTATSAECTAR